MSIADTEGNGESVPMEISGAAATAGEEEEEQQWPAYREFNSTTAAFWGKELADGGKVWYSKAEDWWVHNCETTIDGVLGGFGNLDPDDVKQSAFFFRDVRKLCAQMKTRVQTERCLDGGAGIGRVTRNLLSDLFQVVDLVEGNQRLLDAAPQFLGEKLSSMGDRFCSTLQDFVPKEGHYDCIWTQWVVIYLTDADFVRYLRRCSRGLKPGGIIVIKENMLQADSPTDLLKDEDDSSVTRSPRLMKHIFKQAGLEMVLERPQQNWGSDMLPVQMYALRPVEGRKQVSQ